LSESPKGRPKGRLNPPEVRKLAPHAPTFEARLLDRGHPKADWINGLGARRGAYRVIF